MIYEVLYFFRLSCYVWALFEVGLLAHLYSFAVTKSKSSSIIRALFVFILSVGLFILYRFAWAYTSNFIENKNYHLIIKEASSFTILLIALAARKLRNESLKPSFEEVKQKLMP